MPDRPADPGLDTDLATLRERLSQGYNLESTEAALARVEAELSRLREVEESFKHLSSEYHYDQDRGDHLVYRREWEAFDAWQRGDLSFEKRAEAAEARCARLQQALEDVREIVEGWDEPLVPYEKRNSRIQHLVSEALAGPDTPADSQEDKWGPYRELEAENAQLRNIARAAETLLAPINRPLGDLGVAEEALREALAALEEKP